MQYARPCNSFDCQMVAYNCSAVQSGLNGGPSDTGQVFPLFDRAAFLTRGACTAKGRVKPHEVYDLQLKLYMFLLFNIICECNKLNLF
jgi:hypothetical protein